MNGIEKYIDDLGRVVIPMKFRDRLGMKCKSKVFVYLKDNSISISLAERCCVLCGSVKGVNDEFRLCSKCIAKIKEADTNP